MQVIRAGVLGFCMGVRRAVDMAEREAENISGFPSDRACAGRVYTIGPLIHNPQVLESLRGRGVEIIDDRALPLDLEGAAVIIRAHGVTPQLEKDLEKRGGRIVDATCPKVKASQRFVQKLVSQGSCVFLAGEKSHGEIIAIQGYAPVCIVVANRREAEQAAARLLAEQKGAPPETALLGQTTISPEEYREIGEGIQKYFPRLNIIDTICGATRDRQESLRDLCAKAGAVIVAGGRESANTRRLLGIAKASGRPAWLVENAEDLPDEIRQYETVGLCAGASTPEDVIDAIERALLRPFS
jgi:4-hydroxy-3-methylbut-2-enyl diphosphate reductase